MSDDFVGLLDRLRDIDKRGGPDLPEHQLVVEIFDEIARRRATSDHDRLIMEFRRDTPSFATNDTMQGFVSNRPHGYAGDFEIIDRIYRRHASGNSAFRPWDDFFHAGDAAEAVRGRKDYCIALFSQLAAERPRASILDVASGPCRDVVEFKALPGAEHVSIRCVDTDQRAVDFARSLTAPYAETVTVEQQNALLVTGGRYDLVWSAGLFDYLGDELFVRLLRLFKRLTVSGGEVVVGNFGLDPVARSYMEFGDWRLIYRSADQLRDLAIRSGSASDAVRVDSERTGVNLFLRIRVGSAPATR